MTNQEAINELCNLRKVMISAIEEDICYVGFGEDDIEAIEMAVAALVSRPIIEITEIHKFAKPDDVSDIKFGDKE